MRRWKDRLGSRGSRLVAGGFSVTVNGEPVPDRWRLRKAKTLVKLLALAPGHRLHRESSWTGCGRIPSHIGGHQQLAPDPAHRPAHDGARIDHAQRRCRTAVSGRWTHRRCRYVRASRRACSQQRRCSHACNMCSSCGPARCYPRISTPSGRWSIEERLTETHAALATLLGSKLSEQGDYEAALALVEPLLLSRPLDEHLHRVLIEALAGSAGAGKPSRHTSGYARPSTMRTPPNQNRKPRPSTGDCSLGGKPMPTTSHNLPESSTSFVGRRRLLSELSAMSGAYPAAFADRSGRRREEPACPGVGPAGGRQH